MDTCTWSNLRRRAISAHSAAAKSTKVERWRLRAVDSLLHSASLRFRPYALYPYWQSSFCCVVEKPFEQRRSASGGSILSGSTGDYLSVNDTCHDLESSTRPVFYDLHTKHWKLSSNSCSIRQHAVCSERRARLKKSTATDEGRYFRATSRNLSTQCHVFLNCSNRIPYISR